MALEVDLSIWRGSFFENRWNRVKLSEITSIENLWNVDLSARIILRALTVEHVPEWF